LQTKEPLRTESDGSLSDHDPCLARKAQKEAPQRTGLERDAARSRREFRPRDMHEHGAAASRDARAGVVVELDQEVIEGVGTGEAVAGFPVPQPNRAV